MPELLCAGNGYFSFAQLNLALLTSYGGSAPTGRAVSLCKSPTDFYFVVNQHVRLNGDLLCPLPRQNKKTSPSGEVFLCIKVGSIFRALGDKAVVGFDADLCAAIDDADEAVVTQLVDQLADGDAGAADNGGQLVVGQLGTQAVPLAVFHTLGIDLRAVDAHQTGLAGIEGQVVQLAQQIFVIVALHIKHIEGKGRVAVHQLEVLGAGDAQHNNLLHGNGAGRKELAFAVGQIAENAAGGPVIEQLVVGTVGDIVGGSAGQQHADIVLAFLKVEYDLLGAVFEDLTNGGQELVVTICSVRTYGSKRKRKSVIVHKGGLLIFYMIVIVTFFI